MFTILDYATRKPILNRKGKVMYFPSRELAQAYAQRNVSGTYITVPV